MINVRNVHNFLDSFSVYSTPMRHCLMGLLVVVFSSTKKKILNKKFWKKSVSTVTLCTDDVLSFSKTNRNESFCNTTTFSLFSSKSMLLMAVFVVSAKRAGRLCTKSSPVVQTTASFVKSYSKICNRIKRWAQEKLHRQIWQPTNFLKPAYTIDFRSGWSFKVSDSSTNNNFFYMTPTSVTVKNRFFWLLTKRSLNSPKLLKCHPDLESIHRSTLQFTYDHKKH